MRNGSHWSFPVLVAFSLVAAFSAAAETDVGKATVITAEEVRLEGTVSFPAQALELAREGEAPFRIRFDRIQRLELREVAKVNVGGRSLWAAVYRLKPVNSEKEVDGYIPLQDRVIFTMNGPRRQEKLELGPAAPIRRAVFHDNRKRHEADQAKASLKPMGPEEFTIVVPGNTRWLRTGIQLVKDQAVHFTVAGTIKWGTDPQGKRCGPDGVVHHGRRGRPLPGRNLGMLIARIRSRPEKAYGIGAENHFKTPFSGELELGINDDELKDNTGNFRVRMVVDPRK